MFIITFFDSDNDATLESSVLRALLSGVLLLVTPFSGLDGVSGVERDRLEADLLRLFGAMSRVQCYSRSNLRASEASELTSL
jgi:hypothetical protein